MYNFTYLFIIRYLQ